MSFTIWKANFLRWSETYDRNEAQILYGKPGTCYVYLL